MLSDIHGNSLLAQKIYEQASTEEINALVVCGDLTHFGNLAQAKEVLKELTMFGLPVLFVPGNCDPKELATTHFFEGAINIHGKYEEVGSLGFIGVGGSSPSPFNTPFEISEDEIRKILTEAYNNLKSETRPVLVSHSPPFNTNVDITFSGVHAGSRAVREFIEAEKPILVLCGHIHEARGIEVLGEVLIVNPGLTRRGAFAIVDVDGEAKAKLGVLQ